MHGSIGPDPERHLLFSRVREELQIHIPNRDTSINAIQQFGLDESFYDRRIHSLSGGEKVKLALAIAFSTSYDCYILHGVIPWLDERGRQFLFNAVKEVRDKASVLFIEHDVYTVLNAISHSRVYEFSENTFIEKTDYLNKFPNEFSDGDFIHLVASRSTSEVILELKELTFNEYEYSYSYRTSALLNKISISLYKGCSYALIGDNGVGKSTLSKIIFRLVTPDSGQVLLCNQSISLYTRADISDIVCYIGQFPEQQIIFSNIGLYIRNAEKKNNTFSSSIMKKWLNLLIVCKHTLDNFPTPSLSIFQMKILLLTSLVTERTKLVIFDEPDWGVSKSEMNNILTLLREILDKLGCALLIISHNTNLIRALSAQTLRLSNGQLSLQIQ